MKMTVVGVLLPFHRIDEKLENAVNSVLVSHKICVDLTLIDDCRDKSRNYPTVFNDPRVRVVKTNGGQGYGYALEKGLLNNANQIIGLMNSDDLIHPEKFSRQLDSMGDADLSITNLSHFSSAGVRRSPLTGGLHTDTYDKCFLLFGSYGADATWLCKREWLTTWLKPDNLPALDWRIALRSFPLSKISYISEPMYFYQKHRNQTSRHKLELGDLESIFIEWTRFQSTSFGVSASRSVFYVMATPWVRYKNWCAEELDTWISEIVSRLNNFPDITRNQVMELISRRLQIAVIGSPSKYRSLSPLLRNLVKNNFGYFIKDSMKNFKFV